VTAVFADTFYWIAVTTPDDSAYARALEFSRSRLPDQIVTTDEVLSEYLTCREGLTEALTNDRHFEQEGFRALFRAG
jgi:predicted nucleic acid-binding protein